MKMLSLIILLTATTLSASAQDKDPNAEVKEMGLTDQDLSELCNAAKGIIPPFYDWGIPAVFELIFDIEGKPYPEFESKAAALAWLGDIWTTKYSKCYCQTSLMIGGSLDMISMKYEKDKWVWMLYNENNNTGANINQIKWVNYNTQKKGTLLDYIYYIRDESPVFEALQDSTNRDHLEGRKKKVREYGGKRMSEMTEEEIEQNSK